MPELVHKHIPVSWRWLLLIVVTITAATWIRVTDLDSHAILFGDNARDLLVARYSLESGSIPWLGIPSSKPFLHQGPLSIWINMGAMSLFGEKLLPVSLTFAVIGVLAIIGLYELLSISQKSTVTTFVAIWLLSTSPFAIAQSRMAYHTSLIPVILVFFLWQVWRQLQHKRWALIGSLLGWILLVQTGLALVPLVLVIIYAEYRSRSMTRQTVLGAAAMFVLGFVPQLIYDLQQQGAYSRQIGAWLWKNITELTSTSGSSSVIQHFFTAGEPFTTYGLRIFSVDQPLIGIYLLLLGVWSSWVLGRDLRQRTLPAVIEATAVSTLVLIGAYLVQGRASEAYFPPFVILFPTMIAYGVSRLKKPLRSIVIASLLVVGCLSLWSVRENEYFVGHSKPFSYGPSIAQQRELLDVAIDQTNGNFFLTTSRPWHFSPHVLDQYLWLLETEYQVELNPEGQRVAIDPAPSPLMGYPNVLYTTIGPRTIIVFY